MINSSHSVVIEPYPVIQDVIINLSYKGKLTMFKYNKLYVYYGYGKDKIWCNPNHLEMKEASEGYTVAIKVSGSEFINICFHDNQGHWDNNSGRNWQYEINKKGC